MMIRTRQEQAVNSQRGAVSIFIVIFAALFITIVTVGFVQIMLRGQQEATVIDLSQSAYDSALAGVEDAKRALQSSDHGILQIFKEGAGCRGLSDALSGGSGSSGKETLIQTSQEGSGGNELNQAYTCLTVIKDTDDVEGELAADSQILIPLKSTSPSPATTVTINWFTISDAIQTEGGGGEPTTITPRSPDDASSSVLPRKADWSASTPSVIEAQIIQLGGRLDSFDSTNTKTLTLYPIEVGSPTSSPTTSTFALDVRKARKTTPVVAVRCQPTPGFGAAVAWGVYSCRVEIAIPESAGATAQFLRLSSRYNTTSYQVLMKSSTGNMKFDGVQPIVDSTGRANDVFRRVSARITRDVNVLYPEAAVDITGNLCKVMMVTGDATQYRDSCIEP